MAEIINEELNNVSGGTLGPGYYNSFNYQIQPGDFLSVLAQRFRTTVQHIMDLNPKIKNPDQIRAYDWINMPYPDY